MKWFDKIAKEKIRDLVHFRVDTVRLMAVKDEKPLAFKLENKTLRNGIGIISLRKKTEIMVSYQFPEPALGSKSIEDTEEFSPCALDFPKAEFSQILNISIQNKDMATWEVIITKNGNDETPISLYIVGEGPVPHVKITYKNIFRVRREHLGRAPGEHSLKVMHELAEFQSACPLSRYS